MSHDKRESLIHSIEIVKSTNICTRYACRGLILILILLCPVSVAATEKVRLQLKWQHQFQFAGYYAAQSQGYYQAAGLDVEIIPNHPGEDAVQKVLQGKADFGIGATDLLLLKEQGEPVVVLAVIFQHSPLALLTLKHNELQNIHDLAGLRVMIEPGSSELHAYLHKEGLSAGKLTLLPHGFHIKDLLAGDVDAMSTYVTDEPFALSESGQEYMLYSPRSVGIDFYGDNLFTTKNQIKQNPEKVKAFLEASLKGWEYAMQHPEEVIQLIYSRYSQRHSIEHLRFEARQMASLLQMNLVKIGHMNPGRWRHIAETYADLGMMKTDFILDGFLYDPNPQPPNMGWVYSVMGVAALLLVFFSALLVYIYRINLQLRKDAVERKQAEQKIQQLVRQLEIEKDYAQKSAMTDSLTKLANRRSFDETLVSEFYRSKRSGTPLSLIMVDVDYFKNFNDSYGHLAGDECLRRIATTIKNIVMRAPDMAARYGGEEFAIILPETDHHGSAAVAEQIRKEIEEFAFPHPASDIAEHVTVSLGAVTVFTAGVSSPEAIVSLADEALYSAKEKGRNRVEVGMCNVKPEDAVQPCFVRLAWKVTYECGNKIIDKQHRNLFGAANDLLSAIIAKLPKEKCLSLIEDLLTDIVKHFHDEEEILKTAEYPFFDDHIRCHKDLVSGATALAEKYKKDELTLGELFSFLAYDVVAQHMFSEDRKFTPYILKK